MLTDYWAVPQKNKSSSHQIIWLHWGCRGFLFFLGQCLTGFIYFLSHMHHYNTGCLHVSIQHSKGENCCTFCLLTCELFHNQQAPFSFCRPAWKHFAAEIKTCIPTHVWVECVHAHSANTWITNPEICLSNYAVICLESATSWRNKWLPSRPPAFPVHWDFCSNCKMHKTWWQTPASQWEKKTQRRFSRDIQHFLWFINATKSRGKNQPPTVGIKMLNS